MSSAEARQRHTLLALTKSAAIDAGERALAFREICRSAAVALDAARVSIWSYDEARAAIVCEQLYELHADRFSSGLELLQRDFPAYFAYLREERVLAADDAHTDPATAEFSAPYLTPLGIFSMLDAPIRFEGKLWGVVCHEHVGGPRQWSIPDQTFGASMADFVARALSSERVRAARRALEDLNAHLEQLVAERTATLAQTVETLQSAQAQLVESEKLASLGSLVAGIAHELNTPLGVAVTAASASAEQLAHLRSLAATQQMKRSDLERYFERAHQLSEVLDVNLARAAALVRNVKQVAVRQSTVEHERFKLGEAIVASVASLQPEWRKAGLTVTTSIEEEVWVHAAPSFVFQVVSNLIVNAMRHAYPDGSGGAVRFVVRRAEPLQACVVYEDDGVGATEEVARRMWEPFYTTKRGQGGSGLGMHIIWNLVVGELGGTVRATSAPGQGMRIQFRLPCLAS